MKAWINAASLVGLCCASLCFLGLPLLVFWMPAVGLGWLHDERLARLMLLMFLGMFGAGTAGAFREHRNRYPGLIAIAAGLFLIGASWRRIPMVIGWLGMAGMLAAWLWDRRLLGGQHGPQSH